MIIHATMLTTCLPFLVFPEAKPTPKYRRYLGKVLPSAVFGLLIIYSLRNVSVFSGSHRIPELISIAHVLALHVRNRKLLLHIAGVPLACMIRLTLVF